jgi:hypothetical protein
METTLGSGPDVLLAMVFESFLSAKSRRRRTSSVWTAPSSVTSVMISPFRAAVKARQGAESTAGHIGSPATYVRLLTPRRRRRRPISGGSREGRIVGRASGSCRCRRIRRGLN